MLRRALRPLLIILLLTLTPAVHAGENATNAARRVGTEQNPGLSLIPGFPPEKTDDPFLTTQLEPADVDSLRRMVLQADRLEVREYMQPKDLLYASAKREDIEALAAALDIDAPAHWFYCMCAGDPILHLYQGDTKLGEISNHHGVSIRTSLWVANGKFKDNEKWLQWFERRGLPGPRREVEEADAEKRQSQIDDERWFAAMPASIRPLWDPDRTSGGRGLLDKKDLQPLRDALSVEFPDEKQRAMALFAWYGSGQGPWNGVPYRETVPEELLHDLTAEALAAAAGEALTRVQMEGAARFFAGPAAARRGRRQEIVLPEKTRQTLFLHIKRQRNVAEEKFEWAEKVFSR